MTAPPAARPSPSPDTGLNEIQYVRFTGPGVVDAVSRVSVNPASVLAVPEAGAGWLLLAGLPMLLVARRRVSRRELKLPRQRKPRGALCAPGLFWAAGTVMSWLGGRLSLALASVRAWAAGRARAGGTPGGARGAGRDVPARRHEAGEPQTAWGGLLPMDRAVRTVRADAAAPRGVPEAESARPGVCGGPSTAQDADGAAARRALGARRDAPRRAARRDEAAPQAVGDPGARRDAASR